MDWLFSLWGWLNGNKTIIAGYIALATVVLQGFVSEFLVGIWHVNLPFIPEVVLSLQWISGLLGGLGITHKALKYMDTKSVVNNALSQPPTP